METIDRHDQQREVDIAPRRTHVSRELAVTGERAEMLWQMYEHAFAPLEELAMQQHLWSREEVLAELADERIVKFVGWSDDRPVGLGMITRHLDLVPMISPTFLRRRFPEQAERDAIFYGIMIFVRPDYRGKTMFARLGTHMAEETAQAGGVVLFDVCSFNRDNGSLDQNLGRLARPFPRSSMSMVDQQSWFAVELPEAISGRARPLEPAVVDAPTGDPSGTDVVARANEPAARPVDAIVDQLIELATD